MGIANVRSVGVLELNIDLTGKTPGDALATIRNPEQRDILVTRLLLEYLAGAIDAEDPSYVNVNLDDQELTQQFQLTTDTVNEDAGVVMGESAVRWPKNDQLTVDFDATSVACTFSGRLYLEYFSGRASSDAAQVTLVVEEE